MKLLSPTAKKSVQGEEATRELIRAQEFHKAAKDTRLELANAEADFNTMLAGQRLRWADEEREHTERVVSMTSEIAQLEARRARAMVPVDKLLTEAQEQLQGALEKQRLCDEREDELEAFKDLLEDRLDEVGAREQDLSGKEQVIAAKMKTIAQEYANLDEHKRGFETTMREFLIEKEAQERAAREERTAIFLEKRTLEAEKNELQTEKDWLTRWKTRLEDERDTLDRAFTELRKLKADIEAKYPPSSPE